MNKQQIVQLVNPNIQMVRKYETSMRLSTYLRDKHMMRINQMIVWNKSPYGSFANFIKEEIPEYTVAYAYNMVCWGKLCSKRFKSHTFMDKILKEVSYELVLQTARKLTKVYDLSMLTDRLEFIKEAKKIAKQKSVARKIKNSNVILLHLDKHDRAKLDNFLSPYGFKGAVNGKRTGISKAFSKWLATV